MSSKPKSLLPPEVQMDLDNLTAAGRSYLAGWMLEAGRTNPSVAACLSKFHRACTEAGSPMIDALAIERPSSKQAA